MDRTARSVLESNMEFNFQKMHRVRLVEWLGKWENMGGTRNETICSRSVFGCSI